MSVSLGGDLDASVWIKVGHHDTEHSRGAIVKAGEVRSEFDAGESRHSASAGPSDTIRTDVGDVDAAINRGDAGETVGPDG